MISCGTGRLNDLENAHVHRFTTHRFDDRQHDVTTIENGNRQHVQNRQVHIQNHAEPQREPPAAFASGKADNKYDRCRRAAQVLQLNVRLRRCHCADCLQRARHTFVNLFDRTGMGDRHLPGRVPANSDARFLFALGRQRAFGFTGTSNSRRRAPHEEQSRSLGCLLMYSTGDRIEDRRLIESRG